MEMAVDVLHSEALSMLYTINIASQMGCHKVLFETDSAQPKIAMTTEDYDMLTVSSTDVCVESCLQLVI